MNVLYLIAGRALYALTTAKLLSYTRQILWPATLLVLCLVAAGCKTTERRAYQVIGSVSVSVDTAMKVYADMVVAGKVSPENQAKVKRAYEVYQSAMASAHLAIMAARESGKQGNDAVNIALDAVSASATSLIETVKLIINKPN